MFKALTKRGDGITFWSVLPGSVTLGWDAYHSNESRWKPREVPLDEDRILVLDVD